MVVKWWWWCLLVHVCFHFVRFTLSTTILNDRLEVKAVMVSRYMNLFFISNWIIKPHFCHWSLLTCTLLVTRNKYDFLHWLNLKPQSLLAILLCFFVIVRVFLQLPLSCNIFFSAQHCWFDVSMGIQPITKKTCAHSLPKVFFPLQWRKEPESLPLSSWHALLGRSRDHSERQCSQEAAFFHV